MESEQVTPHHHHGLNKGCGLKFHVGSWVQQTPEEGQGTYRPKRYEYKDEDNCPKTLNDKNHWASSQKFRQLIVVQFNP